MEEIGTFTNIDFLVSSFRAIIVAPLAKTLSKIVTIPKTTIEYFRKTNIPIGNFLISESIVKVSLNSFVVARYYRLNILGTTGTTFYFENTHTRIHHFIHEVNSFEVLRRHDVFVINSEFDIRILIVNTISTAAHLHASTTIGRSIEFVQREIAFARHSHTQSTMTEHFDTNKFAIATNDILFNNATVDFSHLVHIEFARQHYYISKLSIETQRLNIRNVELSAEMHLYALRNSILHHRHVGSNDSTHTSLFGIIHNLTHKF